VLKIIKADRDIPIVAKEAVLLISIATEEFLKRLTHASHKLAEREKRATVQQRDVASLVRRVDEFMFLDEIIGWPTLGPSTKRKPNTVQERDKNAEPTMLDRFFTRSDVGGPKGMIKEDQVEGREEEEEADVFMNEDGTMGIASVEEL